MGKLIFTIGIHHQGTTFPIPSLHNEVVKDMADSDTVISDAEPDGVLNEPVHDKTFN